MIEKDRFYSVVGSLIKAQRKRAKRSQEDLAIEIGLSRAAITHIESGRMRVQVHTLFAIGQALGVPPDSFFPLIEPRGETICEVCEINYSQLATAAEKDFITPYRFEGSFGEVKVLMACPNCLYLLKNNPHLGVEAIRRETNKARRKQKSKLLRKR